MTSAKKDDVKKFWEERGLIEGYGGTNDVVLQKIEEQALVGAVPRGSRVCDIGCGDGQAIYKLYKEHACTGLGIDYSENFIKQCREKFEKPDLKFVCMDIRSLGPDAGTFDVVITKRCLINLENADEQRQVFGRILSILKPGGLYLMVESFVDGNEKLNEVREPLGLTKMAAPWHNVYMRLTDTAAWEKDFPVKLEKISHFSSTYYFLSRVVNAKLAHDKGEEPSYDSEINKLALSLPSFGEYGATKMLVWKKVS